MGALSEITLTTIIFNNVWRERELTAELAPTPLNNITWEPDGVDGSVSSR